MTDYFTERYKLTHRLQGVANGLSEEIAETLAGALETVTGRIIALEAKADGSKSYAFKKKYLDQQKAEIEKVLNQVYQDIGKGITDKAVEVAQAMPEMTSAILERVGINIELGVPKLSKSRVESWIASSQIEGTYWSDYLKKLESNAAVRIIKETRQGKILSESVKQVGKRIQTALDIGRRSAESFASTAMSAAANFGEFEYWQANSDKITGLRWYTEIDRQVCPQCIPLDQQVFKVEDCQCPPLHMLCRCFVLPEFRWDSGKERLGTRPARIDTDARTVHHRDGTTSTKYESLRVQHISTGMTHSQWVQSLVNSKDPRDVLFSKEMLGPTRWELVRSGKLTVDRLYYGGTRLTINQLKELTAK